MRRTASLGRGGHGIAGGDRAGEVLVLEEQRREGLAQMLFNVVGEDAEEQVGADALLGAVVDGAA